jgi:hypothetical protein
MGGINDSNVFNQLTQELFKRGWVPARPRYWLLDELKIAIQKSRRRMRPADDELIQMALVIESPGFFDIFQVRLDEVNGKLSEEEGNNLAQIIKLTIGAIRDWHSGSARAFLKLEAVRKILTAEQWNLDDAELKAIATFDQSHYGEEYPELARGFELLRIMAAITAIVEPKKTGELLSPSSYVVKSNGPLPSSGYQDPKIWEAARSVIDTIRNQTLQSLAIRVYKDILLQQHGINADRHDFTLDIKKALQWGKENRESPGVKWVVFNNGESYPYKVINDGWKGRWKNKKKTDLP